MVYLMRHSQAAPSDYRTTDDARWLTSVGRTMAAEAGRALAVQTRSQPIDLIVTSPLSRTVQTAELVAHGLGWQGEIQCLESLRSEAPAQRAVEELLALGASAVLAVTHEPIVSSMCALLSGQELRSFQSGFRPAEIACLVDGHQQWRWDR